MSTEPATRGPRLAPLAAHLWDEGAVAMLRGRVASADRYLSGGADAPRLPNVLGILGHHPRLAAAWLGYNGVLLDGPALDPRLRELLILRVAWRTRSQYEWIQHARIGRSVGLSNAHLEALAEDGQSVAWTPLERLLLDAADQLLTAHRIDDATWDGLAARLDARQLLEAVFVVGSYLCLAMVFGSAGLELDPDMDPASAPPLPGMEE
ncbi:carboxymuconolactone decarboxylase family protein [Actinocorallia populi]|uniref:carboxymuconolactone decarboxylase family protein n=1 Tax=Actinocorallia populi TaxID=2079200 RepID=UPI000D092D20|nr:carboxymuconolactone decarboxylase family protein [Actinocorallia populi]